MAKNKRLGIYWGETGFSFVEVVRDAPTLTAFVPFSTSREAMHAAGRSLSDNMLLLDSLQKTVRNRGFSTVEAYLSLPSRDILIRWFRIPWMKSSEIQNVVAFEAKKYTPFETDEMSYTYYPTMVTKDGAKQIGILFVAIRKITLESYTNVLIQSGLNVVYSEPGATSVVRSLMFSRQLNPDQVTAVLQTSRDSGELIITSHGQVKFIRDFKIHAGAGAQGASDGMFQVGVDAEDILRARIFSEVRISFEFFSRQFGEADVNRVLILSSGLKPSFWAGMKEELGISVDIIDPLRLVNRAEGDDPGIVNAFGAAMTGRVASVVDFNLSEGESQPVSIKREEVLRRNRQLIFPILVAVVCAAVIAGAFLLSGLLVQRVRDKVAAVSARIGARGDMDQAELEARISDEQLKVAALMSLPSQSRVTPLIIRLIQQLPRGAVLENFTVGFDDRLLAAGQSRAQSTGQGSIVYAKVVTGASMSLSGYAYLNDNNAEFDLANNFVYALRGDTGIAALFSGIKMTSLRTRPYGKKKVTGFAIIGEGK